MFNQPQDRSLFLNSVHPAAMSSNLPASAHAGGPQQQVHAGDGKGSNELKRFLLSYGFKTQPLPSAFDYAAKQIADTYDAAIRLANAEPSWPVPVAEPAPNPCPITGFYSNHMDVQ